MQPASFFKRAQFEADRYGLDDWVFVRELIQNSRDAGSTCIHFDYQCNTELEEISCSDDGCGMSESDIQNYLLNLYASTKETTQGLSGFFGVGFWAILRFKPKRIDILSRKDGVSSKIIITPAEGTIESQSQFKGLDQDGTLVRLFREKKQDYTPLTLKEKLLHYAGRIQPLEDGKRLSLYLNSEQLNKEFSAISAANFITGNGFECAIKISDTSHFRLFHRGLLTCEASRMEDLFINRVSKPLSFRPRVLLNLKDVIPVMNRQNVYEDEQLHDILDQIDHHCHRLHEKMIKSAFPLSWKGHWQKGKRMVYSTGVLILIVFLTFWGINHVNSPLPKARGNPPGKAGSRTVSKSLNSIHIAPLVKPNPGASTSNWLFEYQPPDFNLFSLGELDPFSLEPRKSPTWSTLETVQTWNNTDGIGPHQVQVSTWVEPSSVPFLLPTPPFMIVVIDSIRFEDGSVPSIRFSSNHRTYILPTNSGLLNYSLVEHVYPHHDLPEPLALPETYPASFRDFVSENRTLPRHQVIQKLVDYFQSHFVYKKAQKGISYPAITKNSSGWIGTMFEQQSGDCDLLNGLGTQLLLALGIQAELHFGLVGDKGLVQPELHAWIHYYDQRWQLLDLSQTRSGSHSTLDLPTKTDPNHTELASYKQKQINSLKDTKFDSAIQFIEKHSIQFGFMMLLLVSFAVLFPVLRRRKKGPPIKIHPRHLERLYRHQIQKGIEDPLLLKQRKILETLSGKRISLHQYIKKLPNQIMAAKRDHDNSLVSFPKRITVLDYNDPYLKALSPYLPRPFVFNANEIEAIDFRGFNTFHAIFKNLFPTCSLVFDKGKSGYQYFKLPLKDLGLGNEQLVIGTKNLPSAILDGTASRRVVRDFIQNLLDQLTRYRP